LLRGRFPARELETKTVFSREAPFAQKIVEGNELEVGQSEHFPARSGSRPTPGPGSSRGRSAMALETPPHVGRRPGSLRASVGASSSGVKSASSEVSAAESMRAVAARLEKHTAALRSAMDQTSRLDDGSASGASAKGAVAVAAARALDAASSSSDDDAFDAAAHETRLRSYRTADVHIKKAAAKIAGHKKWYADRANSHKKATESCASALEELRLASMVLQRRHDEDSVSSAAAARTRSRGASETTKNDDDVQSASSVVVDALVATARKLRVDADKIAARELDVQTQIARAERRRDDAVAEARAERVARETAPVKIIVKRVPPASFAPSFVKKTFPKARSKTSVSSVGETKRNPASAKDTMKETRDPLREAARATLSRNAASVATMKRRDEEKEKKNRDDDDDEKPKPVDPNPSLVDALRAATEARDDLERRLRETQKRLETQTHELEVSLGDAAERAETSESNARLAAEEGARWRALYVAQRDDLHRGVGADEAEALRCSLRRAEDAHRRELSLLGAEHGNQCASLRRALADTERERVSFASAVDASRRAATKAQEALAAEKELRRECEVLKRRSDGELRRVSKRCEALEADVGSLKKALEETERASRDLLKAETDARLRATREADLKKTRDEASRDVEWRVESLEVKLSSALESAKREKTRADDAERALDDARRRAVEQQARMAEAARARKGPDAE
jgi:hypothetical protein